MRFLARLPVPDADPADFLPALQRVQDRPPSPLGRKVLWTLLVLVGGTLLWSMLGKLDIVAVADGKLVPATYVKIVQPVEQGVVREILVREGETVREGQNQKLSVRSSRRRSDSNKGSANIFGVSAVTRPARYRNPVGR